MTKRRVVVTGIGMISPLGVGNEPTWQGLVEGRSGIGPITKFDASVYACRIAGEVRGFNAEDWIEKKEVKKSDTFIHYAVAAAGMAVQDGHLDCSTCDGERFGVIVGSGIGGLPLIEEMHTKLLERGPSRVSPFFIPGLIVNLGAGIVILEELEHAKKRGATIYCELTGYGMSSDAYHITSPAEDGSGMIRVMRSALRDAQLHPEDIDYINAHGTSTAVGDRTETIAIKQVFGEYAYKVAVSSTKSMTGHLLGAAGGLEAAIAAMTIKTNVLPPTINYETPDPDCDLDYVPNKAREQKVTHVMSNSFGFGGTNATLIFSRLAE